MWKAWGCSRPVLQTVRRAGSQHQRVLARRAAPPCARTVVTTARDLIVRQQRTLADTTKQRWQIARAASSPHLAQKVEPSTAQKYAVIDGNEAAAYVAYAMSDISFIYPISPATSMGEHMDKWAATGKKNIQGQVVDVNMMQSEGGAAGALHGAAAAGALTSTFTASQGLLLMIPNMYLLAGELVPSVLHVSARTVSKHALSIFNDHSDVMATRQTGFAMMCSTSVQEVLDLGFASHVASIKARIPFLHFFDGYRTSAEMSKVKVVPYEDLSQMFPADKVQENLHNFALNPTHPSIRGTGQRPDIFFQSTVAATPYYQAAPDIVAETLDELAVLTGRPYKLFEYYGHPEADRVAICMGSASKTLQETVDHMNNNGEKVGSMTVHLYRPWSAKHFLDAMPSTVKKIAVLDRTREDGAVGMPLFLDVNVTMSDHSRPALITGAQYGLASKEFTPAMAKAVLDNLNADKPRMRYVIGIDDDVTHTSLPYGEPIDTTPAGTTQCLFWGLGSDGTVGASKSAIKTIGMNTDLKAQGHFVFDSHKGGGVTVSHVRFGPSDIKSEYMIQSGADYLSCSHPSYVHKFEMVSPLKEGGTFVLNAPWSTIEDLENNIPTHVRVEIAKKRLQFYTIHATKLASDTGLGKRINSIMQAAFYGLSGVLPVDQALSLLKDSVSQQYKHKGPEIVAMNQKAIDHALDNLHKIEYPASWASLSSVTSELNQMEKPDFVTNVMDPVLALKGDDLPVSAFEPGGYEPIGTSMYEKRGIAPTVPVWKPDACTQCNYCAIVCPHAVIRPFLLEKTETKAAPPGFEYRKAKGGSEVGGFDYSIQVSPYDCTGCEVCVETCPDDALYMAPFNEVADKFSPHWDYAIGLPERQEIGDKYSVKGSQFLKPLMEFSGACAGCGETPYLKLATQLFGDRMVIANASGCSSVWGGTATTIPFTTNDEGHGPAWGRSLFEDNAEYGFGMALGTKQRRQILSNEVQLALEKEDMPEELREALTNWQKYRDNPDKCNQYSAEVKAILENIGGVGLNPKLRFIYNNRDMLRTQSHWMVGGDGWAYDIGYGGLDHILSRNENVNVLVLDTEMYSNTGGQVSKATQLSTVTKFASMGKRENKKDLGLFAMQYGNVFVASVALGANMNQCVTAFKEAEHYPGTSLIIAYSPCIDWGIDMKKMVDEQREAVDTGYWTLYRYDPRRMTSGLNPFQLDSKKIKGDLQEYLSGQNRFEQLKRNFSETAGKLHDYLYNTVQNRHKRLQKLAMDDYELLEHLKKLLGEASSGKSVTVLYGSETGNAENLANVFATEFKRRGVRAKCVAMDDFDLDDLPNQDQVFCVVSTCGQGELPSNCRLFWKALSDKSLPSDFLKNTKFAVFGLGDSSYVYFNEAAKLFHKRFGELSAESVLDLGLGDDKDEDRYESKWDEWLPNLFNELKTDPPAQVLLPPTYNVVIDKDASSAAVPETVIPPGSKLVPLVKNRLLTPEDYDRDIRHYEFDLAGSGMKYNVGDCLGIYSHNDRERVLGFCDQLGVGAKSLIRLEDTQDRKEPLPSVISASQLFTEVLDVFGKPSRRFYETLAIAVDNESDREELMWMLTKDGNSKLRELTNETVTYADLLTRYPTKKLSLDYLLDHIPRIKPRLYSIASSSEMHGDMLHLCIVKNDWTTPSGNYHVGLCTNYLQALSRDGAPVDLVASRVNGAGITVPNTNALPCVMVGLGTGIAPFRAMVQDREVSRTRGETVGPMALFFGARYRRTDFTYGDEFDDYHSGGKGVLSVLSTAFSRDQAHKIYVQNRISEYPEVIYDYLGRKNGYFYLCGPAGNVPTAVRQAVVDSFVSAGGHSPAEAEKIVTQMQIEGRYNVEAW